MKTPNENGSSESNTPHTQFQNSFFKKAELVKKGNLSRDSPFVYFLGSTRTFTSCSLKASCEIALPFSAQKSRILTDFLQYFLKCLKKTSEQLQALQALGFDDIVAILS